MTSITVEIPMPPKQTHPNARCHFRTKARYVKRQREEAYIACLGVLSERGLLAPSRRPNWTCATIQATFHKPGNRAKAADPSGLNAWLKASEDGIQDAQIIVNDRLFTWLPPIELLGADAGKVAKVVIVISEISNG